jgi:ABC-type nitrate/sulfonate/bicarbonate transport system substrate-binding protein
MNQNAQTAKEKIRIGIAHHGAGLAPVFAALESGAFDAAGLVVELVDCPGHPGAMKALLDGEVDFVNSVGPELLLANQRHRGDAVVIASAISRSAQQVSARPGLGSREDLRGKRWGVGARSDMDECAILTAFDRWGWEIGRDANIVVVGSDRPRLDLLLDAQHVDVAIMHAPETFQAAKRGWRMIEDLGRLDVAFQNSCAATTRRFEAQRWDVVLRYVEAFCEGVWRFRTDARFGVDVLRKHTGEADMGVLEDTWVLFARLMGGMMFPSVEGMRNAADTLHRLGGLPAPVAPDEVVDLRPVAALEQDQYFSRLMGLHGRR